LSSLRRPVVTDNCMQDPLVDSFYKSIWHKVAENNTKLYRQVFRCMPDSEVRSWREYHEYNAYSEKFMQSQGLGQTKSKQPREAPATSGPPGSRGTESVASEKVANGAAKTTNRLSGFANKILRPTSNASELVRNAETLEKDRHGAITPDPSVPPAADHVDGSIDEKSELRAPEPSLSVSNTPDPGHLGASPDPEKAANTARRSRTITFSNVQPEGSGASETTATQTNPTGAADTTTKRRRRGTTKSSMKPPGTSEDVLDKTAAEELLKLIQGHLVLWPYDWLVHAPHGFWDIKRLLMLWDAAHRPVLDVYT